MASHATSHWHGIISVPMNVKVSFLMSSGYRKALEAKERLLEIIEAKIVDNQCPFLTEFMQKTGGPNFCAPLSCISVIDFTKNLSPELLFFGGG